MLVHVNILTGAATEDLLVFSKGCSSIFRSNLWVPVESYKIFRHHPILKNVRLRPRENPVELRKPCIGSSPSYYNINQFDSPWTLFQFFLYFRQIVNQVPYGLSFQHETELLCHSVEMGLTENQWITRAFLKSDFSEFRIRRGSRAVVVENVVCGLGRKQTGIFYNIQQISNSKGLKERLQNIALSVVNNKPFHRKIQSTLFETSRKYQYVLPYWFHRTHLELLRSCGIYIRDAFDSFQCSQATYFNIQQTSDPLGVYRTYTQTAACFGKLRNFQTSKPLTYSECFAIVNKQRFHKYSSPLYIMSKDLRKSGAEVKPNEKKKPFRLVTAGVSKQCYNLDQIINPSELLDR